MSEGVVAKAEALREAIIHHFNPDPTSNDSDKLPIGSRLISVLTKNNITKDNVATLTPDEILKHLLQTKQPYCFAESHVNGLDWTPVEFEILSLIGTRAQVTIFDDGQWGQGRDPYPEGKEIQGTFYFTNGPVLNASSPISKNRNSEYKRLTDLKSGGRCLNEERYKAFIKDRFLPIFRDAIATADAAGKKAYVAVPGVGCGLFAGNFQSQLKSGIYRLAIQETLSALPEEDRKKN